MSVKVGKYIVPTDWKDIPFKKYMELGGEEFTFKDDKMKQSSSDKMMAVLLGCTEEDVLSMKFKDYQVIGKHLQFIEKEPNRYGKHPFKFKGAKELTYDEFMSIEAYKKDIANSLPSILRLLLKENKDIFTEEYILNLPTTEVVAGFFTVQRRYRRSTDYSLLSLSRKLMWMQMKRGMKKVMKKVLGRVFKKKSTR